MASATAGGLRASPSRSETRRDPILKERLFGLTGPQGNYGEDVKKSYFFLDSTPTHSYLKALYTYPHSEYPYAMLVEEARGRTLNDPEHEFADTGVFDGGRYFDVLAEYAKAPPDDVLIRITAADRGPEAPTLHVRPTLWFRNTWIWGCDNEEYPPRPVITGGSEPALVARHATLGRFRLAVG